MNISIVIQESAKYLYKYDHILRPEKEIQKYLNGLDKFFIASNIEREVKKIYREGQNLFYPDKEYLNIMDIRSVLSMMDEETCLGFCMNYSLKIDDPSLYNVISYYDDDLLPPIRLKTRKKIAHILPIDVFGQTKNTNQLFKVFSLSEDMKGQHIESIDELFELVKAYECSTATFRRLLLSIANSSLRDESENRILVAKINNVIEKDGFILEIDQEKSQYHPVYHIKNQKYKAKKSPQHLIFASIGMKPNIGISDALDGKVSVISEDGDPLTYDRKILDHLNWAELEDWWEEVNLSPNLTLKKRLIQSLDSPPEVLFFKAYFSLFQSKLGEKLPALIPQVYLAYDPMRAKDLPEGKTRIRQRVDFLMILPNLKRVIIEIDGKHHYAHEDGRADPHRYAEMVRVDRELRLRGYEVFRFGGAEFYNNSSQTSEENAIELVRTFFIALFEQYEIGSVVG